MVEEFFQEFNQLAYIAGYNDGHHGDILIKLIKDTIHNSIINSIYNAGTLPDTYAAWIVGITNIDNLQHQWAVKKKSHAPTVVHKTIVVNKMAAANVPTQKTGTGIIYGGVGQKMDRVQHRYGNTHSDQVMGTHRYGYSIGIWHTAAYRVPVPRYHRYFMGIL